MLNWNKIVERIFTLFPDKNQGEIGEILNLSQDTISRWATGKAKPRWDHLYKISQKTGKSEEWILTGSEGQYQFDGSDTPPATHTLDDTLPVKRMSSKDLLEAKRAFSKRIRKIDQEIAERLGEDL